MNRSKSILAAFLLLLTGAVCVPGAVVVEHALPTLNLNDAAGANRSNIEWAFGSNYLNMDTFRLPVSPVPYVVTSVTMWSSPTLFGALGNEFSSVSLYGGLLGSAVVQLANGSLAPGSSVNSNPNITHTVVQYVGALNYQGPGTGNFFPLVMTTFSNLSWLVNGGADYLVGMHGVGVAPPVGMTNPYWGWWFTHSSRANLSGGTQSAPVDNDFYVALLSNLSDYGLTGIEGGGYWGGGGVAGGGGTDLNYSIMADPIPEPVTMMLTGAGLLALAMARRRR